jgi:hypothetical protein
MDKCLQAALKVASIIHSMAVAKTTPASPRIVSRGEILMFIDPSFHSFDNILCYKGDFVLFDEGLEYVGIDGNAEYAI